MSFQSPQWGSNSKDIAKTFVDIVIAFQSPQWGSNSKERYTEECAGVIEFEFQSPQWGSNSKVMEIDSSTTLLRFSPRNGEVILKSLALLLEGLFPACFSPRNGEVILKSKTRPPKNYK